MDTSYILDLGNLGTNVANGSVGILTLPITSRIYPDFDNLGSNVANGSVGILTYQI
jgi:hypothetical protein